AWMARVEKPCGKGDGLIDIPLVVRECPGQAILPAPRRRGTMQIMDDGTPNGQQDRLHSPFAVVQRWQLPHGLAVAVALPRPTDDVAAEVLERLHPEERRWASDQPPRRRVTWVGGRLALRAALRELGAEAGPLFATDRGAPLLPDGLSGSVTHK